MKKIIICFYSPLYNEKTHGGLQKRIIPTIKALSLTYEVIVFCGEGSNIMLDNVVFYPHYDSSFKLSAVGTIWFYEIIQQCDLLISIETLLPEDTSLSKTLLIMGGVAYDWSIKTILSRDWDMIVVPSDHSKSKVISIDSKLVVKRIYNGYEWKHYRAQSNNLSLFIDNSLNIVFPHRAEKEKGLIEAINATNIVNHKGVNAYLYIPKQDFFVSNESNYVLAQEIANSMTFGAKIIFHNWINNQQIATYFSCADISLALGTFEEGFGASIVEAIYCGTPVIATSRGSIPELLPPEHGLFIVENDIAAIVDCILHIDKLLRLHNETLQQMLRSGKQYITSNYCVSTMVKKYCQLINTIIPSK